MNLNRIKWPVLALTAAATIGLISCSSSKPPPDQGSAGTAYTKGVPGGVAVETYKITANVTAIDTGDRKVTLLTSDGKKTTVKCGPDVINFDQIHVGDQLKATVTQELAVNIVPKASAPMVGAASVVALAPKGAKPGGVVADTVQVTATVMAIDLKHHKAVLQFPDGSTRTVAVRPDVDLTRRQVGEPRVQRWALTLCIMTQIARTGSFYGGTEGTSQSAE
jgi:hypothetical protein